MHALCAHAQGSVDLHVESYGVAGPLVETLYTNRAEPIEALGGGEMLKISHHLQL